MTKPRIQARVGEDTKKRIEQLADEKGIDQSEAVRRTLRKGLDDTRRRSGAWSEAILLTTGLMYLLANAYTDVSGLLWSLLGFGLAIAIPMVLLKPWQSN